MVTFWQIGCICIVAGVIIAQMQAEVMENCCDAILFQIGYQSCTFFKTAAHQIEHVGIVGRIFRKVGHGEVSLCCQVFQTLIILFPDFFAAILYQV